MDSIRITHYSDVLCVWAYVSQVRIDELCRCFPAEVELDCRYFQVFGDTRSKLQRQWAERGGAAAYGEHVTEVVAQFDHVPVHPEIWQRNAPRSSMPSHLFLCAIRLLEAERGVSRTAPDSLFQRAAWAVRRAFFEELADVSRRGTLLGIAEQLDIPVAQIEQCLDSGAAHAALCEDLEGVRDHGVHASPTLIFNEGRQRLTGNVGYRIIEANVRELLERPSEQQSWC